MRILELRQQGLKNNMIPMVSPPEDQDSSLEQHTVTAALIAIVILGTGLVFVLLLCYACVLRRLCCPDFGRRSKSRHHQQARSTTTQHTSCDVTKFDTLTTTERSPC